MRKYRVILKPEGGRKLTRHIFAENDFEAFREGMSLAAKYADAERRVTMQIEPMGLKKRKART